MGGRTHWSGEDGSGGQTQTGPKTRKTCIPVDLGCLRQESRKTERKGEKTIPAFTQKHQHVQCRVPPSGGVREREKGGDSLTRSQAEPSRALQGGSAPRETLSGRGQGAGTSWKTQSKILTAGNPQLTLNSKVTDTGLQQQERPQTPHSPILQMGKLRHTWGMTCSRLQFCPVP